MKVTAGTQKSSHKERKLLIVAAIMLLTGVALCVAYLNHGSESIEARMVVQNTRRMKLCRGFVEDGAHDESVARKLRKKGQRLLAAQYLHRSRMYMSAYKICVDSSVSLRTVIAITDGILLNVAKARAKANELQMEKFGNDAQAKKVFSDRMKEYSFRAKAARLYSRYLATGKKRFYQKALAAMRKGREYGAYAMAKKEQARECRVELREISDRRGNIFDLKVSPTARFYAADGLVRVLRKVDLKSAHAFKMTHKWYALGDTTLFVRSDNWAMTVENDGCVVVGLYEPNREAQEVNPIVQNMVEGHIDVAQDCGPR